MPPCLQLWKLMAPQINNAVRCMKGAFVVKHILETISSRVAVPGSRWVGAVFVGVVGWVGRRGDSRVAVPGSWAGSTTPRKVAAR
jgi:hypothetical protein